MNYFLIILIIAIFIAIWLSSRVESFDANEKQFIKALQDTTDYYQKKNGYNFFNEMTNISWKFGGNPVGLVTVVAAIVEAHHPEIPGSHRLDTNNPYVQALLDDPVKIWYWAYLNEKLQHRI